MTDDSFVNQHIFATICDEVRYTNDHSQKIAEPTTLSAYIKLSK